MTADFVPAQIVAVLCVYALGGAVKGLLGFGLPLTTVAVLPLIVPIEVALVINACMLPFINVVQFVRPGRMRETLRRSGYVVVGVVAGVPLGAVFVTSVDDRVLLLALGVFVVAFTAIIALNPSLGVEPARDHRRLDAGVGLLAGAVGALTTVNGPIFVMYLVGLKVDRALFVSTLGLLFIVSGVMFTGSFWAAGMVDGARFALALACVPAALVGMVVGDRLGGRLPAKKFRLLVLAALCALGLNLVLQGAAAWT